MPWHLEQAYRRAGSDAQHAFWGLGEVEALSMLHQLAAACPARRGRRLVGMEPSPTLSGPFVVG
jgi:hypothetical protein